MSDIQPEVIHWLWGGFLAEGKLSLLAGDAGLGKSFMTCDMAARISTGRDFPCGVRNMNGPCRVVILNAEDGAADTIRPRLDAHDADSSLVHWIDGAQVGDAERGFQIAEHIDLLRQHIADFPDTKVVILDPIKAFTAGSDGNKADDVRTALNELKRLAEDTGVAVLAVAHLNKAQQASAHYRVGGAIEWVAVPRVAWVLAKDPDDDARRLLMPLKVNVAPDSSGYAFRIGDDGFGNVVVQYEDARSDARASDVLAAPSGEMGERLSEAVHFLKTELADGPKPATKILRAADQAGISRKTLDRAKNPAGVESARLEYDGGWVWRFKQ